jgi:hypothetical protein
MTYSECTLTAEELTIDKEGAQLFKAALSTAELHALESSLAGQPRDQAVLHPGTAAIPRYQWTGRPNSGVRAWPGLPSRARHTF